MGKPLCQTSDIIGENVRFSAHSIRIAYASALPDCSGRPPAAITRGFHRDLRRPGVHSHKEPPPTPRSMGEFRTVITLHVCTSSPILHEGTRARPASKPSRRGRMPAARRRRGQGDAARKPDDVNVGHGAPEMLAPVTKVEVRANMVVVIFPPAPEERSPAVRPPCFRTRGECRNGRTSPVGFAPPVWRR